MDGRVCTKCNKKKKAGCFEKNGKKLDGSVRLRSICKACGSRHKIAHTEPKTCACCGETKDPEEFYDRRSYCKSCSNKKSGEYKRGKGRAAHNSRMVKYYRKRWKNDPLFKEKVHACGAVYRAKKRGALKMPDCCPSCERKVRLQAHHHKGYEAKYHLDVVWLCSRCHRKTHS